MRAIDLCNILKRSYKKGEFQCNMDSCGNKPCDLCTVEKFENEIREDERRKCQTEIDELKKRIVFWQVYQDENNKTREDYDSEIRADERAKTITDIEKMFLEIKYGRFDVFQFVSIDSVLKKLEQLKEQK